MRKAILLTNRQSQKLSNIAKAHTEEKKQIKKQSDSFVVSICLLLPVYFHLLCECLGSISNYVTKTGKNRFPGLGR